MLNVGATAPTEEVGETVPEEGSTRAKAALTVAEIAAYFPQLEILDCLGRGGMGVVYRARQPKLNRIVALKILAPERESDPRFAARFTREAQALARLSHPHIVTVYDFGEVKGMCYLLMEFVDGVSLRQLIQNRRIAPEQALAIVPRICEALQYAHEQGVVHRDIKPENVLLDAQGRVKIADFGIAKIVRSDAAQSVLTEERQVIGTPQYMAPEQLETPQKVDHRADIYSLGVVFYEMLTGELPLGKFQPPSHKVQVDVRLDEVVLHSLEKEPDRRYQRASDVRTDVETISTSAAPAAGPTAATPTQLASVQMARRQVNGPAIGLVVTGIFNWALLPIAGYLAARSWGIDSGVPLAPILLAQVPLFLGGFLIFAGLKMRRLEAHTAAIVASALAMLVTPGNVIGLPVGIWALVVLLNREVRAVFQGVRTGTIPARLVWHRAPDPVRPASSGAAAPGWFVAIGRALLIGLGLLLVLAIGSIVMSALFGVFFGLISHTPSHAPETGSPVTLEQTEGDASISIGDLTLRQPQGGQRAYGSTNPAQVSGEERPGLLTVGHEPGAAFASIQAALDAASEGATIRIGPGHFAERLEITRPVRLIGAGWSRTVIRPTQPWSEPSAERMREMDRTLRAAESDAERARLREEFARELQPAVIRIHDAEDVFLEGLKFSQLGVPPEGRLLSGTALEVKAAALTMDDCAIVGSPGNGVFVTDASSATIRNTLIAAVWNTGVVVMNSSQALLEACDIRNCHYAGVTIKRGTEVAIERCRISGAAWHGIRYDHVSPRVEGNLIFGNARSGIYASGNTAARVRQNIFHNNEMNGMSCWFDNQDVIEENTFVDNQREALSVLGSSAPDIRRNVFAGSPVALAQGRINGNSENARVLGHPRVQQNLFWNNATNWVRWAEPDAEGTAKPEIVAWETTTENVEADPQFRNPPAGDFTPGSNSLAARDALGAPKPIALASPWPLQPEEKAIIPDGDTRDSRQWKRAGD